MIRDAFPLWAALLIVVRDVAVLIVGAVLLAGRHIRIDVRAIGKVATFSLMTAIPWIAWGTLGYVLHVVLLPAGWLLYAFGIVAYYAAAALYVGDIRRATSHRVMRRRSPSASVDQSVSLPPKGAG